LKCKLDRGDKKRENKERERTRIDLDVEFMNYRLIINWMFYI